MVDGRCVFLEEDNLCYLQKQFGGQHKPVACRTYPSVVSDYQGALTATGSYSCRGMGNALLSSAGRDALVPTAADQFDGLGASKIGQLPFSNARPTEFSPSELWDFLMASRETILLAPSVELGILATRIGAEACERDPRLTAPELSRKLGEERCRADSYSLATTFRPNLEGYLSAMSTLIGGTLPGLRSSSTAHQKLSAVSERYCFKESGTGDPARFREDYRCSWLPNEARLNQLARTFAADTLFSLAKGWRADVMSMLHAHALLFSLARTIAIGLAGQRNNPVTDNDFVESIAIVERHFLHDRAILDAWTQAAPPRMKTVEFIATTVLVG